ncbi:MAG TPA: fibronectin type III domain-containing protein [Chitinophagales bacterium]|nr:fibronectin type III domain-containing protein [Chitinophagales bacterium]HNM28778.1 fibronectin type III domain-containing protein [Chitinophagales bacterium]
MKKLLLGCLAFTGVLTAKSQVTPITVSGEITTNTTWTKNNIYLLNGFVYVEDGATLTIEPGTLIKGDKDSKGTLIITRTGMINAAGTACEPIVFTSNQPAGSRTYGDWGGVIILGEAPINVPGGTAVIEGGVDTPEGDGVYGGALPADNSGTFTYVRIEFPGIPFLPGNEINGLTMGGVGSGTTINHIQVSYSGDDSFEWFGGRVNSKYLIAYRGWDDDFDTDYGYRGKGQFFYALRDPNIADVSGSNGQEQDNDATGSANTPTSRPLFSNITIAGPKVNTGDVVNVNYKRGAHDRRNTMASTYNSIIMGYPECGLKIEGVNTSLNAQNDSLQWKKNILSGHGDDYICTTCDVGFNIDTWASTNGNATYATNALVGLVDPFNLSNPDPRPTAGSAPTTNGTYFSGLLADPFFTATSYAGAFSTTNNWTDESWVNFDCQNTPYNTPGISNNPVVSAVVTSMQCANTGAIDVSVSGGIGSYTYLWNDGATTQDRTGLNAGSYTVTVTSGTCTTTATYTVSDITITKPTSLTTTQATHCSIKLNWAAVPGAGSYEVRYRITGGTYSSPVNVGAVTSYTFTGLAASTSYDLQVRAKCPTGAEKSAYAKKTSSTVACGAPTSQSAGSITANSAVISWSIPCSVTNYNLQYRKNPTKAWTTVSGIATTSYTLTGLLPSSTYEYRIASNCGGTLSAYTGFSNFVTLPFRLEGEVEMPAIDADMEIYPNPAVDEVNMVINAQGVVNVIITNMLGQVVYNLENVEVNGTETVSLSLEGFDTGIYHVTIQNDVIKLTDQLVVSK